MNDAPSDEKRRSDQLETFRAEHRDLDHAIATLTEAVPYDQLQLQRLKKRKLWLKDMIERLEDDGMPDIVA